MRRFSLEQEYPIALHLFAKETDNLSSVTTVPLYEVTDTLAGCGMRDAVKITTLINVKYVC